MWTVIRTFEAEPEARVVEAFLKAHAIDVQLLGTHTNSAAVAPGSVRSGGLRMMVREEHLANARSLLAEQEARAHLSVVEDTGSHALPGARRPWRWDRVAVVAVLIGLVVWSYLKWVF